MNEAHFAEIEKVLLYVSEARERAERATQALRKDGAESHLVDALRTAEHDLQRVGKTLMQETYFVVSPASSSENSDEPVAEETR